MTSLLNWGWSSRFPTQEPSSKSTEIKSMSRWTLVWVAKIFIISKCDLLKHFVPFFSGVCGILLSSLCSPVNRLFTQANICFVSWLPKILTSVPKIVILRQNIYRQHWWETQWIIKFYEFKTYFFNSISSSSLAEFCHHFSLFFSHQQVLWLKYFQKNFVCECVWPEHVIYIQASLAAAPLTWPPTIETVFLMKKLMDKNEETWRKLPQIEWKCLNKITKLGNWLQVPEKWVAKNSFSRLTTKAFSQVIKDELNFGSKIRHKMMQFSKLFCEFFHFFCHSIVWLSKSKYAFYIDSKQK